ncbi:hypothetical protein EG327_002961 [Venturia inaequalis]|uniref:Gem-associated protein 5 TPR domain-containing protein n=1 Tax=Venturia inaequalis TaxID=5025 RepID=A0A8H3VLW1_VENIN|nr:hypothetical protein EG327_002961 [Venturia inaequalis]
MSSFRSESRTSSRQSNNRSNSRNQHRNDMIAPPPPSLTPANDNLEACAATATFFLYAQRNVILVLHHDTLAIDRRFEKHKEDVLWIAVDNVSDRGSGRLVVSYDATQTTIVWDLLTGHEVARFASYEEIRVAAWMKNSNIAFGNSQGNVILFEPSTSEHISARTIFDPITALAPSGDSRTFAIGYMNGSILVATLQPFTILHTLSSNRAPSPLSRLAWHGSSSKQKSDMLAAQTIDGDLRVWSIPKTPNGETPSVIRVLSRTENDRASGLNWFGWSKMGRIIQYSAGLTFVWDVRTKRVTYESVPTVDGLVSIANYGPTATLFTLGRNHTVQQYDLNPAARPMLVQNVQHVPAQLPPSPPISDGEGLKSARYATAGPSGNLRPNPSDADRPPSNNIPVFFEDIHSESESDVPMSPLARISKVDPDEDRDQLGPLSPVSSRASTTSRSSAGGGGRRQQQHQPQPQQQHQQQPHYQQQQQPQQQYQQQQQPQQQQQHHEQSRIGNLNDLRYQQQNERPSSPGMVSSSAQSVSTATTFSVGSSRQGYPQRARRESISTRSLLSTSTSNSRASNGRSSRLRQEVLRSPEETKNLMSMDLFPYTKARLGDIPFRPPIYDQNRRTPDDLRIQMLNVVFGWPDDVEDLIRDELAQHPSGSASSVMLSKWLGDLGADIAASMIGSESMTSSDWMLLALSSMGQDSQKKVGEAFVQRLLEKGDIHPAVSILLGLGEYDEAVEVYVSRKYYMEAVLLTCLFFPTDWQRQSYLVRKWGEVAVGDGHPELAVRCFSCTTLESSEPWFSPRAQDAVYATQQMLMGPDTPLSSASPVSAGGSTRIHPTQAGLKLVTNFNAPAARGPKSAMDGSKTPMVYPGETPIEPAAMESAFRPSYRDPASAMSARTATPGGYGRRRYPSSRRTEASDLSLTTPLARMPTPMTAIKGMRNAPSTAQTTRTRRSASTSQASSFLTASEYQEDDRGRSGLPSPAQGVFARLREEESAKNHRGSSRERKPSQLSLDNIDIVIDSSLPSGATQSSYTNMTGGSNSMLGGAYETRRGATSPGPLRTGISMQSAKIRSIDQFINSLEEANYQAPDRTHEAPERPGSRSTRRAPSEGGRRTQVIRPAKRSPSSPVSMSPDDPALQLSNYNFDDERFYKRASPTESAPSISMYDREARNRERSRGPGGRSESKSRRNESAIRIETKREPSRRRGESTTGERSGRRAESREPTGRRAESTRRERSRSRNQARQPSYEEMINEREGRGRSAVRGPGSATRSPSSPSGNFPMSPAESNIGGGRSKIGERVRERSMSRARNRSPAGSAAGGRKTSPDPSANVRKSSRPPIPRLQTNMSDPNIMNKRELAAKELEERRLSLARRPSAPPIVHPHELIPRSAGTPSAEMMMGGFYKHHIPSEHELIRGHTADPHIMRSLASATSQGGVSNKSVQIGLPATPRAMRHPKYMGEGEVEQVPAVPEIPANFGRSNNDGQQEQYPQEEDNDTLGFLPTTTFQPFNTGPSRSASAPPEKLSALGHQRRTSHTRQGSSHSRKNSDSGDIIVVSPGGMGNGGGLSFSKTIDQTIRESQIMFVDRSPSPDEEDVPPVMLPELQHLAGPLPPPPPPMPFPPRQDSGDAPTLSAVAFMPYEEEPQQQAKSSHSRSNSNNQIPQLSAPEATTPGGSVITPGGHRRGRNSNSISESVGSKFSGLRNRLRDRTPSRTRTQAISPPVQQNQQPTPFEIVTQQQAQRQPAPYESLPQQISPYESLPQATFGQSLSQSTFGKTPSPYESLPQQQRRPSQGNVPQARMPYETQISAAVNPAGGTVQEQSREQQPTLLLPSTTFGGYRNPKEIARQMREEQLQQQREYGAEISRDGAATAPPRSTSTYGRRDKLSANLPPQQLQPGAGNRGNMI